MNEELKDPFFVQKVNSGEEIVIDFNKDKNNKKLLLECIICKKEFDVNSRKNKKVPSLNYCGSCYDRLRC